VKPLIAALKDTDFYVQQYATEALWKIGIPAIEPLMAALMDSNPTVRMKATLALSKIDDFRAASTVQATLSRLAGVAETYSSIIKQGDPGQEDALIDALNQFGNKKMAEDYQNCGNPKLEEAARAWVSRNGYETMSMPSGRHLVWGSKQ